MREREGGTTHRQGGGMGNEVMRGGEGKMGQGRGAPGCLNLPQTVGQNAANWRLGVTLLVISVLWPSGNLKTLVME